MPTNSTANATETRFSVPTASAANAVVSSRPSTSVTSTGTISRQLRTARNSSTTTSTKLTRSPPPRPGGRRELLVRQRRPSRSAAHGPRRWPRTPARPRPPAPPAWPRRPAAPRRSPASAGPARSGTARQAGQRPASSDCHDSGWAARPARSQRLWNCRSAGSNGARLAWPRSTPCPISASAPNRPRAEGSAASWPRNGWASTVLSSRSVSAAVSRNSSPSRCR